MAVHQGASAAHFVEAFQSILEQTLPPSEIVLVIDGPIDGALAILVDKLQREHAGTLRLLPLAVNKGLGAALQQGLTYCRYEIVARMDADDICFPHRFEKQLAVLAARPEIDLVGGWINEFISSPAEVVAQRKVPEHMVDIIAYAKSRSPFNHPTVMFRKQAILAIGNYQAYGTFEDYLLWSKFILANKQAYNIQEPLLYFRMDKGVYKRRGGLGKTLAELRLQHTFYTSGFIHFGQYLRNILVRGGFRLMPNGLRGHFYRKLLK
ncbi:glycosyltransferase [Olivibacter ginsenosidimutans]|uniref:Glycosyltransferase n=2 Tax=Olivibacter ginsenosidimutans TaxID=1176537 RepID=A0ABP9ASG6_9SPHI